MLRTAQHALFIIPAESATTIMLSWWTRTELHTAKKSPAVWVIVKPALLTTCVRSVLKDSSPKLMAHVAQQIWVKVALATVWPVRKKAGVPDAKQPIVLNEATVSRQLSCLQIVHWHSIRLCAKFASLGITSMQATNVFNTQWKNNVMLRTVTNAKETIPVNIVLLGSIK